MRRNYLLMFLVLCTLHMLPACAGPVTYSAEPTEAKIIDVETKQPVEGVVVVAHWVLEGGLHLDRVGDLVILETITDKQGRFHFPAWGPIRHWKNSRLTYMDPRILIFKSGYEYQVLSNRLTTAALKGEGGPVRRSDWNGKTIALKPFKGTGEEYAHHLSFLHTSLRSVLEDCNWKKIPRMLLALKKQKDFFRKHNIRHSLYAADYIPTDEKQCGSPEKFFKNYRP